MKRETLSPSLVNIQFANNHKLRETLLTYAQRSMYVRLSRLEAASGAVCASFVLLPFNVGDGPVLVA